MAMTPIHGHAKRSGHSPEHRAWCHMKSRCLNPKDKWYKDYGGRGIRICDQWLNNFEAFLKDMGSRPDATKSLDRRNNDADYTPDNCHWADKKTQSRNTRRNKITVEIAKAIRAAYRDGCGTRKEISHAYGVSMSIVGHVIDRGDWK